MKPPPFAYRRPDTVAAAVKALQEPDAKVIAGGQSLVPMLAMRLARPAVLVDINGLDELARIQDAAGGLRIGAAVRQRDVETDQDVAATVPLLPAALRWVGHREIRNRGTVVGSIAHADPAAELPCVAVTLDAVLTVVGPDGIREVKAREAFVGPFQTVIEDTDLITHVTLPARAPGEGFAFHEVARRHGDFALCGVAACVRLNGDERDAARVGVLGVGPTPALLDAGGLLVEDHDVRRAEARRLAGDLTPSGDMHGSAGYRRRLAAVLIDRAVSDAWTDAVRS